MDEFWKWFTICCTGIFATIGLINGVTEMGIFAAVIFVGALFVEFTKTPNKSNKTINEEKP